MRAVLQRVKNASVEINGRIHSQIGAGILILLSIENTDNLDDITWLSGKISRLRIFNDREGTMNLSVQDIRGELLVVSQFTLHASTKKGNRPSYIRAAKPEAAIPIYENFIRQLEKDCDTLVQSGKFGAMMNIKLVNDGPVTIVIDTKNKE